jgi:8-oxo-dGTP diphosphatase
MSYIPWLRSQIGHQKTIVVFATVVLRDQYERILLQHRADFKFWGLPGGVLEPGESLLDCARRELLEETGLSAGELRLVGIYTDPRYDTTYPNGDQVQHFNICFEGQVAGGQMQADGEESLVLAFVEPKHLPLSEMPNFYVDMLQDALHGKALAFAPPFYRAELIDQISAIRPKIGNALYIGAGSISVVVNEAGKILMVQRTDDGEWSLPGGFTHIGENAAHTAVREVFEECGINVQIERILGIHSLSQPWVYPNGDQTQTVATIFRAQPLTSDIFPDHAETSQVDWMSRPEVLALQVHPTWKRLHQAAIEHLDEGYFLI